LTLPPHVLVIPIDKCLGKNHLGNAHGYSLLIIKDTYLKEIVAQGGEGIMLREPGSSYIVGRSKSLKRVKVSYSR
jgi:hypothetical protein